MRLPSRPRVYGHGADHEIARTPVAIADSSPDASTTIAIVARIANSAPRAVRPARGRPACGRGPETAGRPASPPTAPRRWRLVPAHQGGERGAADRAGVEFGRVRGAAGRAGPGGGGVAGPSRGWSKVGPHDGGGHARRLLPGLKLRFGFRLGLLQETQALAAPFRVEARERAAIGTATIATGRTGIMGPGYPHAEEDRRASRRAELGDRLSPPRPGAKTPAGRRSSARCGPARPWPCRLPHGPGAIWIGEQPGDGVGDGRVVGAVDQDPHVSPSTRASRAPPESPTTTGLPHAAASMNTLPQPSTSMPTSRVGRHREHVAQRVVARKMLRHLAHEHDRPGRRGVGERS